MKFLKNFTSIAVAMIMFVALLPLINEVEAIPAAPKGNVSQRISQLKSLFDSGSYFSGNGNACTTAHSSCSNPPQSSDNCSLSKTMNSLGYSGLQGNVEAWTCAAFARYAYYYIFGNPWDTTGDPTTSSLVYDYATGTGSVNNALPGDIFIWRDTNGISGSGTTHFAVYIGTSGGERKFFQANVGTGNRTNRVSYGTTYNNGYLRRVVRANNRASLDNIKTITLNYNASGVANDTIYTNTSGKLSTVEYAVIKAMAASKRPNCVFDSWRTLPTGGTQVTASTVFTSNATIYAHWKYKITFNSNGGTAVSPNPRETGTNGKLSSLPTPKKTGYRFEGWYTSLTGGTKITTSYAFSNSTTVYAHWVVGIEDGIYKIKNHYSEYKNLNNYLDVLNAGTASGTQTQIWGNTGSDAQRWIVTRQSNGSYTLRPVHAPSMYLDVANASTSNNALVKIGNQTVYNSQKFFIEPSSFDGYFNIKPSHVSNMAIMPFEDSYLAGAKIVMHQFQSGWYSQQWSFVPA